MKTKNIINIGELYDKGEEYVNFSCKPLKCKLRADYITDENQSVKWNREQVKKHNEAFEQEVKNLNTQKNKLCIEFQELVRKYIIQETGVSKDKADRIFSYLHSQYHAYGIRECIANLDDLLFLFQQ